MSQEPKAESGLRVVIASPNASPNFGGEAMLPLQYFLRLSDRGHIAYLVTHERNRSAMTSLRPDLASRMLFTPDTRFHRLIWRASEKLPAAITKIFFGLLLNLYDGILQRRVIREIVREQDIDLVHVPTPVSPAAPSVLRKLGAPVIFGPMNGGMNYPPGYDAYESRFDRLSLKLGRTLAIMANFALPAKRRAALLLVANKRTLNALPVEKVRTVELCENGVDLKLWSSASRSSAKESTTPLGIVFLGRLIELKAVDLALIGLSIVLSSNSNAARLDIVGDGPERQALERLAEELGIASKVSFHGFLTQKESAKMLSQSDVLILPSLRECGGAVVLEAMASGLAVIASDWGGPADYLDESCGILVSPVPAASFSTRLSEAISKLAMDRSLVRKMGAAGREKVQREFDWDAKVVEMEKIYRSVIRG